MIEKGLTVNPNDVIACSVDGRTAGWSQSIRRQRAIGRGRYQHASVPDIHYIHAEIDAHSLFDQPLLLDVSRLLLPVFYRFRGRSRLWRQSKSMNAKSIE